MELQLQVTEEELLEFPEVRHDQIILVIKVNQLVKLFSVLRMELWRTAQKRRVATRIAVEAMEAVVQIHIPRLKLKNHTINDQ